MFDIPRWYLFLFVNGTFTISNKICIMCQPVGSLVLTGVAWIRLANEKDQKVNDNEKWEKEKTRNDDDEKREGGGQDLVMRGRPRKPIANSPSTATLPPPPTHSFKLYLLTLSLLLSSSYSPSLTSPFLWDWSWQYSCNPYAPPPCPPPLDKCDWLWRAAPPMAPTLSSPNLEI